MRSASGTNSTPALVRVTCRVVRSNSEVPNSSSADRIMRERPGCDSSSSAAAAMKLE